MSKSMEHENTDGPPGRRARLRWYVLVIFLSSAALLVLEITAGRLIAPYVGVSLYSWTAIIGVILAGLSLGNWAGGVLADRGAGEMTAGVTLAAAGASSMAILWILMLMAPMVQARAFNLLGATFLYVVALFFLPAVLLGVITPLLTTLALRLDMRSGHVVGRMQALAALGSISGTFLTGYVLIQEFGTRNIIAGTGVALLLLAAPFLRRAPRTALSLLAVMVLVAAGAYVKQGFVNPCDRESNYFCIRVVDFSHAAPNGRARAMVLDHLVHGINHETEPALLIPSYLDLVAEIALRERSRAGRPLKLFFAGGGAYTLPRALAALDPGAELTVAELDPLVTATAVRELYLDAGGMRVIHDDARVALARMGNGHYDVIVSDAFHDISLPYHLATQEYAALVKTKLRAGGVYVSNVLDVYPDPRLVKAMAATLAREFRFVSVWLDETQLLEGRQTFVLAASDDVALPAELVSERESRRRWVRLAHTADAADAELPVLSDDHVPVESLIAPLLYGRYGL